MTSTHTDHRLHEGGGGVYPGNHQTYVGGTHDAYPHRPPTARAGVFAGVPFHAPILVSPRDQVSSRVSFSVIFLLLGYYLGTFLLFPGLVFPRDPAPADVLMCFLLYSLRYMPGTPAFGRVPFLARGAVAAWYRIAGSLGPGVLAAAARNRGPAAGAGTSFHQF